MTDNIVAFPGTEKPSEERITPEKIMEAAQDRYDEMIVIGRLKDAGRYECVSTMAVPETLYHVMRIKHRLNMFLDAEKS